MNTTRRCDGGKPRTETRYRVDDRDPKVLRLSSRKAPAPAVECGSGWYHDAAINLSTEIESHRGL